MTKSIIELLRGANIKGVILKETDKYIKVRVESVSNGTKNDWKNGDEITIGNGLIGNIKSA